MKKILILTTLFISSLAVAQTYTADQSKKDFYVNGLLANDGLQNLNFLVCYMKNTNISDFVDKGTYKALIDEKSCEKADGSDSTAEASAATASSSNPTSSTTATGTVSNIEYTPQTVIAETAADGSIDGKGWVELEIEFFDDQSVMGPATAFVKMDLQEDVSDDNQLGTFTFTYELVNDEAIPAPYNAPANTTMSQGYVGVSGDEITFVETGRGPDILLKLNKDASTGITQGVMKTSGTVVESGLGGSERNFAFVHQFYFNDTDNIYCQNLLTAQEVQYGAEGTENIGSALDSAGFKTIADAAISGGGEVRASGNGANIAGENCWGTAAADTKRTVYEYGTYNATTDSKYDAEQSSMPLRATKALNPSLPEGKELHGYAGYWGTHIDDQDRALVTDTTVWLNSNDTSETPTTYNLKQDFLQIFEITTEKKQLADLDKVQFFGYIGWMRDDAEWNTALQSLNFPVADLSQPCDAANGNCEEYAGTISVTGTGDSTVVTFNITQGIDWNSNYEPFDLATPFSFTASQWSTAMTKAGESWGHGWHVWDNTNRRGYSIPYEAFSNVVTTNDDFKTRSRTEKKITAASLPTTVACLVRCLDSTKMNQTMGGIFASLANNTTSGTLNISPYKNVGPWYTEKVYFDSDGNPPYDALEDFEMPAGEHSWIGGTPNPVLYTVSGGQLTDPDTSNPVTWANGVSVTIPSTGSVDVLENFGTVTREVEDKIRNFSYYEKPYSLGTERNYTRQAGHWFDMEVFDSSQLSLLECDTQADLEYQGYEIKIRKSSDDSSYFPTKASQTQYCSEKLHEGVLTTTYRIGVMQRSEFSLVNATTSAAVAISPPETLIFTVPAAAQMRYNYPGIDYEGRKFLLNFEGYGELHNLPGRVLDTCTGTEVGKYVREWKECYRYVHDFIIPDGTILENSDPTKSDVKVLALRGDDFISKKTDDQTVALATQYTLDAGDLPGLESLKNNAQASSSDYIGVKPTTGLINDGDPSVVHGVTVFDAPAL